MGAAKIQRCGSLMVGVFVGFSVLSPMEVSGQLPPGVSLEDIGLGQRPFGPPERSVRLVPWATIPGTIQQATAKGDHLYCAVTTGQVFQYDLQGNREAEPFHDLASLRGEFKSTPPYGGLRGIAHHPDFDENGLFYTFHEESVGSGSEPDYPPPLDSSVVSECVLGEWNFAQTVEGKPGYREIFRIAFAINEHMAQNIGFNPQAVDGDPDYGLLYACVGDNGNLPDPHDNIRHDPFDSGQNLGTPFGSVMRIDPRDPSGMTDSALEDVGRKRSENGKFSIPLTNPFVADPARLPELFAKGFRNPLTMTFSSGGKPIVADVGQHFYEEINLVESGGNYGWGVREGIFVTTYSDQETGDFLGADASQQLVPLGSGSDPATEFLLRDWDGGNPRSQTIARVGDDRDGFIYPFAHFSHAGAGRNGARGSAAAVGGESYSGWWAEELRGIYLFSNLSFFQIFYVENSDIVNDGEPGIAYQLPLVLNDGTSVTLEQVLGTQRSNPRYVKDQTGNLYFISKTTRRIYRFQGTPRMELSIDPFTSEEDMPVLSLRRPGPDPSMNYAIESSANLRDFETVPESSFEQLSVVDHGDGTETCRYRILSSPDGEHPSYFRIRSSTKE